MPPSSRMNPPGSEKRGVSIIVAAQPQKSGRMPPPGMKDSPKDDGQKALPEEAGVLRADEHCIDCRNYDATSGDCAKVEGSYDPQDGCVQYFDKIGDDEPDDEGNADDQDEDDMRAQ